MMSGYRPVSIGIVTEDKPEGSEIIIATPIEMFYDQSAGNVNEFEMEEKGDIPSVQSGEFHSEHKFTNTIRAKWMSFDSGNRMTPPDMSRNQRVMLWKYGNNQEWYWTEMGRSPGMRGKERVIYAWSNKEIGSVEDKADESNSVMIDVNTKEQYVKLSTPQNSGEPCTYEIHIDYKSGNILIKDSVENSIELDSPSGKLTMNISEAIELNTKHFEVNCETMEVNNDTTEVNSQSSIEHNTPLVKNSEDTVTEGEAHVKSNAYVDDTLHAGDINVGGSGGGGTASIAGDINIKGTTRIDGDLHVSGTAHGRYPD